MCGLFGWRWRRAPSKRHRCILASVLANEMDGRGGHSWGWYAPRSDTLSRGLGELSCAGASEAFALNPSLIGHTRYATTGARTVENAHPFRVGNVIGAHNGMVKNHERLNQFYERSCTVDSLHLLHWLDDGHDAEGRLIEAYGALSWCRTGAPSSLYLGRFNGGELAVADLPAHGLVYASTSSALERALALSGLAEGAEEYKVKQGIVYVAAGGRLFHTDKELPFAQPTTDRYMGPRYEDYTSLDWDGEDELRAWEEAHGRIF